MAYRTINGVRTLPLNGWRTRSLATMLGVSEETLETVGLTKSCLAGTIQNLPEFDGENQAYIDQFKPYEMVTIKVEDFDPSYGVHISINGGVLPKAEEPKKAIDHWNTSYPVCPSCGVENEDTGMLDLHMDSMEDTYICSNCGVEVNVTIQIETTYTTSLSEGAGDNE